VFNIGVHGLNYRTKHRPLVSCRYDPLHGDGGAAAPAHHVYFLVHGQV
jgi:hypothetical protein